MTPSTLILSAISLLIRTVIFSGLMAIVLPVLAFGAVLDGLDAVWGRVT